MNKAKVFTEDCEEGDNDTKMRLWQLIVSYTKANPRAKQDISRYLNGKNIPVANIGNPDLISLDDLTEIKKILGL